MLGNVYILPCIYTDQPTPLHIMPARGSLGQGWADLDRLGQAGRGTKQGKPGHTTTSWGIPDPGVLSWAWMCMCETPQKYLIKLTPHISRCVHGRTASHLSPSIVGKGLVTTLDRQVLWDPSL